MFLAWGMRTKATLAFVVLEGVKAFGNGNPEQREVRPNISLTWKAALLGCS